MRVRKGTISELLSENAIPSTVDMHIKALDEIGGAGCSRLTERFDNQYHAVGRGPAAPVQGDEAARLAGPATRRRFADRGKITPDPKAAQPVLR